MSSVYTENAPVGTGNVEDASTSFERAHREEPANALVPGRA